jgi:hypothetical protein
MTLFEYLAIAFSLVLSFAAMRLISGLSYAAQPGRRYWVHLAFVLGHLFFTILVFWNLWNLRDVIWNLPRFVLALAYPGLVYFTACALIPEQASAVDSWRSYYYSARRRFFIGIAAIVVVVAFAGTAILGLPWLHPVRIPQLFAMGIALLGAFSPSPRVHACLAVLALLMASVVVPVVFVQPGAVSW